MAIKSLSIRIDEEVLNKLHVVADYEGRSANSQILILIRDCIEAYEEKHGEIKVGNRADLVLINRHSIHNMPSYDDHAMLAYSADRSDVLFTMVDGRILYQNGEYTSIDEERLRRESQEVFAHYFD